MGINYLNVAFYVSEFTRQKGYTHKALILSVT